MKNKLELTWYNKDKSLYYNMKEGKYIWVDKNDPRVSEPRILIEKKHYGNPKAENLLIKGDNILALRALQPEFNEKIRMVYIDPPFNTGVAFENYDDGLEHSIWLTMMRDRLKILYQLLRKDGILFVHIDDQELGHLKVLLDEVFCGNFLTLITVQRSATTGHKAINPSPVNVTDYIIGYAKDKNHWSYKQQYISRGIDKAYNKYIENINESFEKWRFIPLSSAFAKAQKVKNMSELKMKLGSKFDEELEKFVLKNSKRVTRFAIPNYLGVGKETRTLIDKSKKQRNRVFCQKRKNFPDIYLYRGDRILFYKDKIKEIEGQYVTGEPLTNLWTDIPYQGIANEGGVIFRKGKKPEKMINRLIAMSTDPGDWVLDSFAGSGTTGAVANKMNRKWIMIELGEQAQTHCLKRLKEVVAGKDQSGISKDIAWRGGGGFKYCELGESLFEFDLQLKFPFINTTYTNGSLIRAVCKMDGFHVISTKGPLHGQVNKRYAHITEQFVNQAYIEELEKEITTDESLVVYCLKHDSKIKEPENISIKRMPMALAKKFVMGG